MRAKKIGDSLRFRPASKPAEPTPDLPFPHPQAPSEHLMNLEAFAGRYIQPPIDKLAAEIRAERAAFIAALRADHEAFVASLERIVTISAKPKRKK